MMAIDLRRFETLARLFIRFGAMPAALQKRNATPQDVSELLLSLNWILSLLLKAESIGRLQYIDPDAPPRLLTSDPINQIQFVKEYLDRFSSVLFTFSRTERQTFTFVLENVMEYLRNLREGKSAGDQNPGNQHFIDSRFWFENLFKMVDEKLNLNLGMNDHNDLIVIETDNEISLNPFIVKVGDQVLLFHELDGDGIHYRSLNLETTHMGGETEKRLMAEYLFRGLRLAELKPILSGGSPLSTPLLNLYPLVSSAQERYREGQWTQVVALLDRIEEEHQQHSPLWVRLRIASLLNAQQTQHALNETKQFISRFPAYTGMYEVLGHCYEQKEDYGSALNAFERAAQFSRNRNLASKIKEIKLRLKDKKEPQIEESPDHLVAISSSEEQKSIQLPRPDLLRQMTEILSSLNRPNLLLVGDGGAGKTNLIEQFVAQFDTMPQKESLFAFKEIRAIQFIHLLTGSKYRGQFEEKVLALLNDAAKSKTLLIVEDIHLLFSQGGARGTALDFVNIVRPYLQDRRLQMVGTTHYEELKNTLERDSAFMGCFHTLTVRALDEEQTREIVARFIAYRNDLWNLDFPVDLIPDIMDHSQQLIRSRALPDAPLLLLDRLFAKLRYHKQSQESPDPSPRHRNLLLETAQEIANLPSQLLGISLQDRLKGLEERLSSRIVGQSRVLKRMVSRITAYKRGYKIRSHRPDGIFLLVGPTGVGKTETALILAEELMGSRDALLRIDMSEYMEKFTYSRFIGAAPGYVGYNDTNQLTDKVRQNPLTLILLDELEKADQQLLNIFLQVFDAGRLTDSRGRVVDFSNTVILMTSNVGTELYGSSPLGYQEQGQETRVGDSSLLKMIKKRFSPEFLNRLDDILVFRPLSDSDAREIVKLQLETIRKQLSREGKQLQIDASVVDWLAETGVSAQYGARQLSRVITESLLEPLALETLGEKGGKGNRIQCRYLDKRLDIQIHHQALIDLIPVYEENEPQILEMEHDS